MKRLLAAVSTLVIGLAVPGPAWAQYNPFSGPNNVQTQFFSNPSADGTNCNLGFYASASAGPCANETPGTNVGVTYDYYWGTDGSAPPSMYWGVGDPYTYELTLVGSVAGGTSLIGWWYNDGSGYTFTLLPDFGNKQIGSTALVTSPYLDWGLFIANDFNPEVGGCRVDSPYNYYCSDAVGGFSFPTQNWALLANQDPTACGNSGPSIFNDGVYNWCWLWGAEDNKLEWGPTGEDYDTDYNDYMIAMRVVVPEPLSMGLMATGLVAMAGVGFVQRRRKNVA